MSGLVSGLRPYQQETVICADSPPLEDTMTKSHLPQVVAAFAAVVTTLVLFSSVASLANEDKAALARETLSFAAASSPGEEATVNTSFRRLDRQP